MVRHTDEADDEASDITEYDVDPEDADPYDQITKGDAVDVVYVPNRGKAPSKTKSGVVTYVNRRDDGTVRSVNVDTEDEYDDGTPKTFEFDEYGRITSHGRVRETTIGDVTRIVVRTYSDVDTDDERDVTIPSEGAVYVDTVRDETFTVAAVEDDDRVESRLITWEDGTASTEEEFVDDRRTERLVPADDAVDVPIADGGDKWEDHDVLRAETPKTVRQVDFDKTEEATPDEHGVLVDDDGNAYGTRGWVIVEDHDREPVTDGGTSVDDFEKAKSDVADAVRATDDRTAWEAFGRETQRRVSDVEVGRYAAVAYTLSVDAYAADMDLSRCVVPAVVWGVTDKAYAYDRLGDVFDAVAVFHTGAAGPYVDGIRKKVADAIDPDVVVTEPIADPETVDDREPVTDGGRDVEAVTVYVINGAHETTSARKAERARSNGRRVTAKSRLR